MTDSTESGSVTLEQRGPIALITIDRPRARNAMTWSMYDQLAAALETIASSHTARVAVVRGTGGNFIAGTDIAQFTSMATGEDGLAYERRLDAVIERLETVPVPTIAAIEGYAAGAGLVIASACDLRLCTPEARFGVPIARTVGNCLSMRSYARLVAQFGPSRAKALVLTARFLTADEAHAAGFVMEIVPAREFIPAVDALCERLLGHAPITMRVTRKAVRRLLDATVASGDDLVREAYGSRDFKEGVAAFLAKRPPQWEGR